MKASSARDSRRPAPGMFSTATPPARIASIRPGTPMLRGRVEFERIAPVGVDMAPEHVGALEAGDGAHEDMAVARDEIAALDQQEAEIAGEIGLFEIGLAPGAGRQNADARLRALRRYGAARREIRGRTARAARRSSRV